MSTKELNLVFRKCILLNQVFFRFRPCDVGASTQHWYRNAAANGIGILHLMV